MKIREKARIDKFIQQVSEALGNNEIEAAIAQLQNLIMMADTELLSDIVLLSARYKKLQSDIRKDVLSYDEETKANNKIVDGLFSLVKEIKSQPDRYSAYFKVEAEMGMAEQKQRVSMSGWQKDVLMDRLSRVKALHIPFRILWLDDNPDWSQYEINLLESLGVEMTSALSSAAGELRFVIGELRFNSLSQAVRRFWQYNGCACGPSARTRPAAPGRGSRRATPPGWDSSGSSCRRRLITRGSPNS